MTSGDKQEALRRLQSILRRQPNDWERDQDDANDVLVGFIDDDEVSAAYYKVMNKPHHQREVDKREPDPRILVPIGQQRDVYWLHCLRVEALEHRPDDEADECLRKYGWQRIPGVTVARVCSELRRMQAGWR